MCRSSCPAQRGWISSMPARAWISCRREASCFHTAAQQRYFIEPRAAGRLMHGRYVMRCGFASRAPASPSMKSPQVRG